MVDLGASRRGRTSFLRRHAFLALLAAAVAIPAGLIGYKLFVLKYPIAGMVPTVVYHTELALSVHGHGEDIAVRTYLPQSDSRQTVTEEANASGEFTLQLQSDAGNRIATWNAEGVSGRKSIRYAFTARAEHVRYLLPPQYRAPRDYPAEVRQYLRDEPGIHVGDALIVQAVDRIVPDRGAPLAEILTHIHRYLQDRLSNKAFSGYTDALTALKLGEASCNGKSRLFVAMARTLNIPARLVGGLIMQAGSKRTTHQWVEVYVNGHWVPFDTINDHYAELPANYLTLYYGDHALFKYSANTNFDYFFKINRQRAPRAEVEDTLDGSLFNILDVYRTFEQIGISQNLLKIILMIPLGALVTVVFRNVIGLETFGTFLPALIAAAARETGLLWGMVGFALIILVSVALRKLLDFVHLLHSPKMAIMLTTVVIVMLATTVLGVRTGLLELAHVSLFPIAILAITAERFAIIEIEQGLAKAARITLATLVVIAACYLVMDSLFLQSLILAFPELLLAVIAVNLWLGKWVGMRLSEFIRFRALIAGAPARAGG